MIKTVPAILTGHSIQEWKFHRRLYPHLFTAEKREALAELCVNLGALRALKKLIRRGHPAPQRDRVLGFHRRLCDELNAQKRALGITGKRSRP